MRHLISPNLEQKMETRLGGRSNVVDNLKIIQNAPNFSNS